MTAIYHYCFRVLVVFLFLSTMVCSQECTPTPARKSKPAFACSHFSWTWDEIGWTTFSFSLKNQSGHDVKSVSYRVLFFDRHGDQIAFEEGRSFSIPNGLAQMQSVLLDRDTGASTRRLRASQKIKILGVEQKP
jgi:hypothetical protein